VIAPAIPDIILLRNPFSLVYIMFLSNPIPVRIVTASDAIARWTSKLADKIANILPSYVGAICNIALDVVWSSLVWSAVIPNCSARSFNISFSSEYPYASAILLVSLFGVIILPCKSPTPKLTNWAIGSYFALKVCNPCSNLSKTLETPDRSSSPRISRPYSSDIRSVPFSFSWRIKSFSEWYSPLSPAICIFNRCNSDNWTCWTINDNVCGSTFPLPAKVNILLRAVCDGDGL